MRSRGETGNQTKQVLQAQLEAPARPEHRPEHPAEKEATPKTGLLNLMIDAAPQWEREKYIEILKDMYADRIYPEFRRRIDKWKEEMKDKSDEEIYDYIGYYFKLFQVSIMDRYDMRPPRSPEKSNLDDSLNITIIRSELNQLAKLWDIIVKEIREDLDIKAIYPRYDDF
jgi:hypothetical protein